MNPDELERLIANQINRLSPPAAPMSLHHRVMTAVSPTRPVVRPWSIWPRVWQMTFALGLMGIAASTTVVWSIVAFNAGGDAWWQIAIRAVVGTTGAVGAIRDSGSLAVSSFAGLLVSPAVLALIAIVASAAIAFAVLAAWLTRIARPPLAWSKGASQ